MFDGVQLFNTIIYKFCLIGTGLLRALPTSMNTQALGGGGARIFFSDLGICMLLGGFGGMLPRENFSKRCNLVRFRVYFDQILS